MVEPFCRPLGDGAGGRGLLIPVTGSPPDRLFGQRAIDAPAPELPDKRLTAEWRPAEPARDERMRELCVIHEAELVRAFERGVDRIVAEARAPQFVAELVAAVRSPGQEPPGPLQGSTRLLRKRDACLKGVGGTAPHSET